MKKKKEERNRNARRGGDIFEIIHDEKYTISVATFADTIMHLTQRCVHKALRTIFVGIDIDRVHDSRRRAGVPR